MMATDTTAIARRRGGVFRTLTRIFNPVAMRVAGSALLPLYGVIEHRGRRSGHLHLTPVVIRRTAEGFIIPMPWGEGTDWYRNVRAAGGCTVRWRGQTFATTAPEAIDAREAGASFSAIQRGAMVRFGIRLCLRLRLAAAESG